MNHHHDVYVRVLQTRFLWQYLAVDELEKGEFRASGINQREQPGSFPMVLRCRQMIDLLQGWLAW